MSEDTKKPSDEFGVDVTGSYGNRGYWQGKGSIDTGDIAGSGFKAKLLGKRTGQPNHAVFGCAIGRE